MTPLFPLGLLIATAPVAVPNAASAPTTAGAEQPAKIRAILFIGTKVPPSVARAAKGFVGQPITQAVLDRMVQGISAAYAKSPVALYSVSVPQQEMRDGVVRVAVVEGRIVKVDIALDGPTRAAHPLLAAYAQRLTTNEPLPRSTLERYLSLMRDLPDVSIDASLTGGAAPGTSQLRVAAKRRRPILRFGYDNRSTQILGDGQVQASGRAYNLFTESDQTDLVTAAAPDLVRYRYVGLTHATPIGNDGLRATASAGYLRTKPPGSPIRGDAKLASIGLNAPLLRGYARNLTANLSLDGLNSDNAAFGALIASERTRALRATLTYSDATAKRTYVLTGAASRGLDILGARASTTLADTEFTKFTGRASIDLAVLTRVFARLRVSGQWSRDALPAAERFTVGGAEFGRGFEIALLNADRGIAGSTEVAWRPLKTGKLASSELYGFADAAVGTIKGRGPFATQTYDLASAGGGIRLAYRDRASIGFELARPIDSPFPGYRSRTQATVSWTLSLPG